MTQLSNAKPALGIFSALTVCLLLLSICFVPSASADPACSGGSLASILGTTCDIGNLQFNFGTFTSQYSSFDEKTGTYTYFTAPTASDFMFTPVSSGFALDFAGGPLSISSSAGIAVLEAADLTYTVTDLNPITDIKGEHTFFSSIEVTGGALSPAGSNCCSFALYQGSLCGGRACISGGISGGLIVQDVSGVVTSLNFNAPNELDPRLECRFQPECIASGSGLLEIFALAGHDGNSASWDGTPTTFTFSTSTFTDPTPEPSSLLLLGTGLLYLAGVGFWRKIAPRHA